MRIVERGVILTLKWNLSLEGITEKSDKKHQESWQKHNIVLNLYLGKSYLRHLRGTCSWECLRPIADLFQWTSYWNYSLRNCFEESYGNIRRSENSLQAVSFHAAVDVRVDLHCEVLSISCTEVEIVAVVARKFFRRVDSPAMYLRTTLLTRSAMATKITLLFHFINNFLPVYIFVIDLDISFRTICKSLF